MSCVAPGGKKIMYTYSLPVKRLHCLQEAIEWNASEVTDYHSESVLMAPRKPVEAFCIAMWKKRMSLQ